MIVLIILLFFRLDLSDVGCDEPLGICALPGITTLL